MNRRSKKQQYGELIEALKAEKKRYDIHLNGYGGEVVLGSINQIQYEFWKDRDDLSDHAYDFDNEIEDLPPEAVIVENGSWHEQDDLAHESGCEFSNACWITVYDEDNNEVWSSALCEDALEQAGVDTSGMHRGEFYVRYDSPQTQYVFMAQSIEKGTFGTYEIETHGKFDPRKLSLSTIDIEGWELVDGVSYESVELEDTGGYSTTGKGSEYQVWKVHQDDTK